jgi:hypothetical protein
VKERKKNERERERKNMLASYRERMREEER